MLAVGAGVKKAGCREEKGGAHSSKGFLSVSKKPTVAEI
jgi:hypothetical protein